MNVEEIYEALKWDDPEDQYSKYSPGERCLPAEIAEGFDDLLLHLNTNPFQIQTMSDVISLARDYQKSWWRFIDPALSIETKGTGGKTKIVIAMYECRDHIILVSQKKRKWALHDSQSEYDSISFALKGEPTDRDEVIPEDFSDELAPEHFDMQDDASQDVSSRRLGEGKTVGSPHPTLKDFDNPISYEENDDHSSSNTDTSDTEMDLRLEIDVLTDLIVSLKNQIAELESDHSEMKNLLRIEEKKSSTLQQQISRIKSLL